MTRNHGKPLGRSWHATAVVVAAITLMGFSAVVGAACDHLQDNFRKWNACRKQDFGQLQKPVGVGIERVIEDMERKRVTREIVSVLDRGSAEYKKLWAEITEEQKQMNSRLKELDKQLGVEVERARRDAEIRAWAGWLNRLAQVVFMTAAAMKTAGKSGEGKTANSSSPGQEVTIEEKSSFIFVCSPRACDGKEIHKLMDEVGVRKGVLPPESFNTMQQYAQSLEGTGTSVLYDPEIPTPITVGPTPTVYAEVKKRITLKVQPQNPARVRAAGASLWGATLPQTANLLGNLARSAQHARYIPDPEPTPVAEKGRPTPPPKLREEDRVILKRIATRLRLHKSNKLLLKLGLSFTPGGWAALVASLKLDPPPGVLDRLALSAIIKDIQFHLINMDLDGYYDYEIFTFFEELSKHYESLLYKGRVAADSVEDGGG